MIEKILYHPQFRKHYQRLTKEIKILAEKKEKIFRENPFNSRLKTHKLSGRLKNIWSFSVDKNYRILFIFFQRKYCNFH